MYILSLKTIKQYNYALAITAFCPFLFKTLKVYTLSKKERRREGKWRKTTFPKQSTTQSWMKLPGMKPVRFQRESISTGQYSQGFTEGRYKEFNL